MKFGLLHIAGASFFCIAGGNPTIFGHQVRPKPNREPVTVSCGTRFPNSHDNAAPVWIFTRNRRFDQGRICNRHSHFARIRFVAGAGDFNCEEFCCAFTVLDHLMSEIQHDLLQPFSELLVLSYIYTGRSGRSTDERVRG